MKKFFSYLLCTISCFSALFVFSGCSQENNDKISISKDEAMTAVQTAQSSFSNLDALSIDLSSIYGNGIYIADDNMIYQGFMNYPMWIIYENGFWYEYYISEYTFENMTFKSYIKQKSEANIESPIDYIIEQTMGDMTGDFVDAYLKDKKTVVTLSDTEDGQVYTIIITISNKMFESISITTGFSTNTIKFKYDEKAEQIPPLPNPEGGWQDADFDFDDGFDDGWDYDFELQNN